MTYVVPGQDVGLVGYVSIVAGERLNPFGHDPLYVQLAAVLRDRITSGQLAHLDPLPSEDRLKDEFGISRDTVRRAMEMLRSENLVFTVPHRGTFVGPRPDNPPAGLHDKPPRHTA